MHPHRARVHVAYDTDVCRHIIFVGKVHKRPVGALNKAINYYRDSLHPELQTQGGGGRVPQIMACTGRLHPI